MNVLVATLGSYGDVYPKVGLALELKKRGHTVTLFTNPFFENFARKYDLCFVPVGTLAQYEQFTNNPALFDPRKGVRIFFEKLLIPSIQEGFARLVEHIQPPDTVIVSSITLFAARLVQEKYQIPNVTVHLAPMAFKSAYDLPKNGFFPSLNWLPLSLKRLYWWIADKAIVDPMICPTLNLFRNQLGLPAVKRIMTQWGHSPEMVIGLFPPWFAAPQPDWPQKTRLTGFPLFDENEETPIEPNVRDFLQAGDPPLIFMPGSLMQQADKYFRTAVQACEKIGARAILLSRYEHQIPRELPEGIQHFHYVPFRQILPYASGLIHHGGIGTCAQALQAGIPQLIHPLAYDQHDNAWRIKRLGTGDIIGHSYYQVSELADRLHHLTQSPEVHEHCLDIASRLKGKNFLKETCGIIENLL